MKQSIKLFLFIIIIISTSTIITGCNKPQESTATKPTSLVNIKDSEVTQNVKTLLQLDEKIKGLDITVVTLKGDVKLTGFANNQSQIDYVHQLVRSIQGVHTIHDELTIKQ